MHCEAGIHIFLTLSWKNAHQSIEPSENLIIRTEDLQFGITRMHRELLNRYSGNEQRFC